MAGKAKAVFVCSECGYETPRWYGKCPDCGSWNTLTEELRQPEATATSSKKAVQPSLSPVPTLRLDEINYEDDHRYHTGMRELDRVLGGGIVKGSVILLGGDPGIGKSTILLQICQTLGEEHSILYVSGEESQKQIKLRANRLGVTTPSLSIAAVTDIEQVVGAIAQISPHIVVIDSIQTMNFAPLSSSSGSVSQIRECTQILTRVAKENAIPIFIVGHVNKEGAIAGPKVLEHMVDAVLYFEGERQLSYRILRAVKNRYGSTNEIGVFEMLDDGLTEVENPSAVMISEQSSGVSGSCIACVMEGSRPILTEIQALATKTAFGTPRRMSAGVDYNRMALFLAVLEKRAGYFFGNLDAYLNVIGGLKLDEPAADLAVCLSLVSAVLDRPIPQGTVAFGEVGLTGEIRRVGHLRQRVQEADRLGFTRCILPQGKDVDSKELASMQIKVLPVRTIQDAIRVAFNA